jgi:hypothetical protein
MYIWVIWKITANCQIGFFFYFGFVNITIFWLISRKTLVSHEMIQKSTPETKRRKSWDQKVVLNNFLISASIFSLLST